LVTGSWEADFAEYFAARAVALRRLAYALCADWHTAEDLVQATFLKLYPRWRRIRAETVDAYVRRTLVNTYLSRRRALRREQVFADIPDSAAPDRESVEALDIGRALARLPLGQRVLVVLRYLEDVSVAETAAMLGISEGTVKSQTARAARTLRAALGSYAQRE
jgi:RNA polymerase sigma-70 factor (sigma-E family)